MKYIVTLLFILVGMMELQASAESACCQTSSSPSSTAWSEKSLFHVQAGFINAEEKPVRMADLAGTPTLIAMFYSTCPSVCPLLVTKLKTIEAELGRDKDYRIVLVSFDPDRDTPKVLSAFAKQWAFDQDRWQLWTGRAADIRTLAATLGIQYRKESDGSIAHNAPITLLDKEGVVQLRLEKPDQDHTDWMIKLRNQLEDI